MESLVVDVGEAVASGFLQEAVDEATGRSKHKWAVVVLVAVLGGVVAVGVIRSRRRRTAAPVGDPEVDNC